MLIKEKIAQAVAALNEFDVDCWLTFTRETGINGDPTLPFLVDGDLTWHSALIVTRRGTSCAIVGQYDRKGIEDLGAYTEVIAYVEGIRKPLQEYLRALAPSKIAVNYSPESEICDGLTHGMYLTLRAILGEIGLQETLVQADSIIGALRQRKSASELDRMKRAIAQTERIFGEVRAFVRPGRTEKEIAAFMAARVRERNLDFAWDPRTCPAVFTGPDTAAAHYAPTDRIVEEGHILNMDFGVKVEEYCSDLQRTFYVPRRGEQGVPAEVQRGFDTIVRAIEESRRAIRPGATGESVDAVARAIITKAGYDEFPHGLGHQVGRFAHDGTALLGPAWEKYARKPFVPLEEGMVFTLEPRLTVKGRGIATVEEMVVVRPGGAEYISTPQKALILAGT
ncbi:MAG TPA: Xaa-Pro peptidase family protein [Bacteroidota bacterium]|nr:Xaa-Pro peptidase family protein [Bacteroidota bacterium]